jgi:EAL domain-containing protein (putative c-di-GMP-specific phosphodiesterase class I)
LSEGQAVDPDLADRVMKILSSTGVEPGWLSLGVPVHLLRGDLPEPMDNVRMLLDEGVDVALFDFGAAGDVVVLEELPVRTVRLDDRLTIGRASRAAAGKPSLLDRALTDLVAIAHEAGASVIVDGVDTAAHADWWRHAGADMAVGEAFPFDGEPTAHTAELPLRGEPTQ